ncbi:MAG: hypothetical protein INH34_18630 [Phycisphaerales bacterium]|nr:hypothetical protein [Phycisphaerales bacterium]
MHLSLRTLCAATAFAVAASAQCFSVTTTTVAGNGQNGTMFDIVNTSTTAISIGSFDQCFFSAGTSAFIEIYTKPGTWNGFENAPSSWTLVGSTTNFAHGIAPTLDVLPIPVNVTIPAGATQGFYITGDVNTTVAYTSGVNQLGTVIGSDAALQVTGGVGKSYPFAATFGLPTAGRLWNGRVNYCPVGTGTVVATNTTLGAGCGASYTSFYEHFLTTPSIDLSNRAFAMLNTGSGYVVLPSTTAFVPPSATATNLGLGDDTESLISLSAPLPYPGGSTTALNVCSNGHVSTASNGAVLDYTPTPAEFLGWTNPTWAVWRDFICNATGNVKFEEVGGTAYITWDGVIGYVGTTPGTVTSTFQFQFELATGNVTFVFLSMDTVSISGYAGGEGWVVGYSAAGANANPGSTDLSALSALNLGGSDVLPLTLAASSRPKTGTNWDLSVSNVPAAGVIGIDVFGVTDPGINDLFFLGAPGCGLRASLDVTNAWFVAGATHTYSLSIPNNLALLNFNLFTTSAVLPVPAPNALGVITANGVNGKVGDL